MSKPGAPDEFRYSFAKRLRVAMAARNIRIGKLAEETGVSARCMYSYYEGRSLPGAWAVARICAVLGIDANELLGVRR